MLTWPSGETTGLEVTRATTVELQKSMTEADKQLLRREAEDTEVAGIIVPAPAGQGLGLLGDEAEMKRWCDQVLEAVCKKLAKLPKFREASSHDLLVNNDADVPLVGGSERKRALDIVAKALSGLNARGKLSFRIVSIIMSQHVEFDISGNRRFLAYNEDEIS
jgi:hypothetical protein